MFGNLINSPPALLFGRQGPKASISKGSSWKGQNIGKLSQITSMNNLWAFESIACNGGENSSPNEPVLLSRNLRKRFCHLCRDPSFSGWCQSGPEMQRIFSKNPLHCHFLQQQAVKVVTIIFITLTPSSSPSSSAAPLFTMQLWSFRISNYQMIKSFTWPYRKNCEICF